MMVVSPTPKSTVVAPMMWRWMGRVRSRGRMSATDHAVSQPASAKSAGLRRDTGPDTGSPVTASATMWNTMVTRRTAPTIQRTRGHPERSTKGVLATVVDISAPIIGWRDRPGVVLIDPGGGRERHAGGARRDLRVALALRRAVRE